MSSRIPILLALLVTLISRSTEGGWRTDSVTLLRQTFRYWREIYNTYEEEVALGYCWADYLVQISTELSTNPSALLFATGDRFDTTAWATKSQRNPFPENVMADATQRGRETLGGHLREKRSHATARSTILEFMGDPNGHRIAGGWKRRGKREKWMTNEAGRGVAAADQTDEMDGRIVMTDFYIEGRRYKLPGTQFLDYLHGGRNRPKLRLFWRGSRLWTVNTTPNPALDDDKVNLEAPQDYVEEDARRIVLREATKVGPFSISNTDRPRTSSPGASHARYRKSLDTDRFRFHSSHGRKPICSNDDLRATSDPKGHGVPLNNDKNSLAWWLSQFRRTSIDSGGRGAMDVVKLMDSKGNSSRIPAWLIRAPKRKPRESSRDSPWFPRERSSLESQESAGEAIGGNLQPRYDLAEDNKVESGYYQRPSEDKGSSYERNILTTHPRGETDNFSSGTDNKTSTTVMAKNSQCVLGGTGRQSLSLLHFLPYNIRLPVISILKTLGIIVQIGRQILDVVDSNIALICTKKYLWLRMEKWLDT